MIAKESPAMDMTRMLIGYTPRTVFKGEYRKSLGLSNEKLKQKLRDLSTHNNPTKVIPYMYDAHRRGMQIPSEIAQRYNVPDERYVRDLNVISGVPSEKMVGATMGAAGALTGTAALDYAHETLTRKTPLGNIGQEAAEGAADKIKTRIMGARFKKYYDRALTRPISELYSGGDKKKATLLQRILGGIHGAPMSALAAIPLTSRGLTGRMKGKDKDSARYKTFDWVERHPKTMVASGFAPMMAERAYSGATDLRAILKAIKKQGIKGARKRSAIMGSVGRGAARMGMVGAMAAVPMAYISMFRPMSDARKEEKELINKSIIKKL